MSHTHTHTHTQASLSLQDNIPAELVELLERSANHFVSSLFVSRGNDAEPPGKKKKTVLSKFKVRVRE